MEEKNKRKKALLAKAIAERYGGSFVIFGQAKRLWYDFGIALVDLTKRWLSHFISTVI